MSEEPGGLACLPGSNLLVHIKKLYDGAGVHVKRLAPCVAWNEVKFQLAISPVNLVRDLEAVVSIFPGGKRGREADESLDQHTPCS